MKYREVAFLNLPRKLRNELNASMCGGWLISEHTAKDLHYVMSVDHKGKITENDVMIFCKQCLKDFKENPNA